MGQIQNSINSILSTTGQVAAISKAADVFLGGNKAEKVLSSLGDEVEQDLSKAQQERKDLKSNLYQSSKSVKAQRKKDADVAAELEEYGQNYEPDQEWYDKQSQLQKSLKQQIKAADNKITALAQKKAQKDKFKQLLEDVRDGKNKMSVHQVNKEVRKYHKEVKDNG